MDYFYPYPQQNAAGQHYHHNNPPNKRPRFSPRHPQTQIRPLSPHNQILRPRLPTQYNIPYSSGTSYQYCQPMFAYNSTAQFDDYGATPQQFECAQSNKQGCYYDQNNQAPLYNKGSASEKRPLEQTNPSPQLLTTSETSSKATVISTSKAWRPPAIRILSGCVEKVLLWSKLLSSHAVLFEIIGKIDYVRNGNKFTCEKYFLMRDVTPGPTLQVVFYETDRPLPELTPGSLIKVVGSMKTRSRFQAFSVVLSSQEELQYSQHIFFICDRAAQELSQQKVPQ